jgi:hypothetical protein
MPRGFPPAATCARPVLGMILAQHQRKKGLEAASGLRK